MNLEWTEGMTMKPKLTIKEYLRNSIFGFIVVLVFYFGWRHAPENNKMYYAFIISVISYILSPFSRKIIEQVAFRFIKKSFWQRDLFISPTGGSLIAILELICFVFSIPICLIYVLYLSLKLLPIR